jgi:tRNA nucleotidyltransferase (CCA-adding enzyme)
MNLNCNNLQPDLKKRLEALPDIARWLIEQVGSAAAELNMSASLVGGPVRDLMLEIPNLDLDFVVEGSAIELANYLCRKQAKEIKLIAEHERFLTVKLNVQGHHVDIATARTEVYERPAALPKVQASDLSADLHRRDFTINALAVCVNPERYGELTDYFNGLQDLQNKTIRILHPDSFIEDPTRIVRAARFAARFGFRLDEDTYKKAQEALSKDIFNDLGGIRISNEIKKLLSCPSRLKALDILASLSKTISYVDADLKYTPQTKKNLQQVEQMLVCYPLAEDWIVYLAMLLTELDAQHVQNVLTRLQLDSDAQDHIRQGFELCSRTKNLKPTSKASEIYHVINDVSDHALVIAASMTATDSFAHQAVNMYLEKLKDIQTSLNGADLLKMGLPEGPTIGRALSMLKDARLDGMLKTADDEIGFIKANFPVTTK